MARVVSHSAPGQAARSGSDLRGLAAEFLSGWLGLTLLVSTAALSFYLVQMSSVATAGYELQRLEAERDAWRARNEQLEYELAKRRSLAWVQAQGVERFGLIRPEKPAPVIQVTPQGSAEGGQATRAPGAALSTRGSRDQGLGAARPSPGDPSLLVEAMRTWLSFAGIR